MNVMHVKQAVVILPGINGTDEIYSYIRALFLWAKVHVKILSILINGRKKRIQILPQLALTKIQTCTGVRACSPSSNLGFYGCYFVTPSK